MGSPGHGQGLRNLLGAVSLWRLLPMGVPACGTEDPHSRVHFSGFQELLKRESGLGFHSVVILVLLTGSFESLLFDPSGPLVTSAFSTLSCFASMNPQMCPGLRRSFCHTSGAAVSVSIPCLRSLSLVALRGFPGHFLPFGPSS